MAYAPRLVRDVEAGRYLERVLIAAVITILATRGYLQATGFPQIGGGGLHIAHMLWGGLLMLVGNVLLLAFLGRGVRRFSAFVVGVGFGLFIDELGKFITTNNDYFYQPTIAIIYTIMVVLFFLFRGLERGAPLSDREKLANAAGTVQDRIIGRASAEELRAPASAGAVAATSPSSAVSGMDAIRSLLDYGTSTLASHAQASFSQVSTLERAQEGFQRLVRQPWLHRIVLALFVVEAVVSLVLGGIVAVAVGPSALAEQFHASFSTVGHLVASVTVLVMVVVGIILLPRSRPRAYRWLRQSVLVSICLLQVFQFYEQQFGALVGLAVDLLMLATLDAMIAAEATASA